MDMFLEFRLIFLKASDLQIEMDYPIEMCFVCGN